MQKLVIRQINEDIHMQYMRRHIYLKKIVEQKRLGEHLNLNSLELSYSKPKIKFHSHLKHSRCLNAALKETRCLFSLLDVRLYSTVPPIT